MQLGTMQCFIDMQAMRHMYVCRNWRKDVVGSFQYYTKMGITVVCMILWAFYFPMAK